MENTKSSARIVQAIAAYLKNPEARPHRADVDRALWENLQAILLDFPDLLAEFQANPTDIKLQAKVEIRMEDALQGQPGKAEDMMGLLRAGEEKDSASGNVVENSKNVVIDSNLHAGGNIQVGDITYGSPQG